MYVAETVCVGARGLEKIKLKSKGARTGCVKKPSGKKLPACGANLILQGLEGESSKRAGGQIRGL